ncbi:NADH dehydrogenase [ubiquinone] 1 alpha subcomplex subunit 10, mitochondrial [Condylostylus longicornis]|uniref:NADH dehydrogenase [ubiquinone] 1 alpha subcomplex subunit 10, mitochondrial n=1 Tax=Condylostylus longicornis TaxID=2530218 RepID=UPI00244E168F|nr:NADH dehydrogenase [ubiquinone] 1 alpha subcomplex subunit 10, mitochondrial [Condylostylus longicornis]
MAGIVRVAFVKAIGPNSKFLNVQNALPAALSQKCKISGKTMRGSVKVSKPKPWPYKEKGYGLLQAMFDKTSKRLDENSKIICVEGPIAAGKTQFAKELADELEMLHMQDANMDMIYINPYGYDMRKLDPQLPESTRSFDEKNFCANPNHPLVAQLQIRMYMLRYSRYIDALAHVLSTGQGVVIERSPFSDVVFAETLYKHGYISKGARSVYHDIRHNTISELMKPHLVIYLDNSVSAVKEKIKARNLPHEVNSKVFTDEFLKDMELNYKLNHLKEISVHAELLVYDWSNGGETEVVVEDIERIDFNQFEKDRHNKKMKDWRLPLEWDWCERRIKYGNDKHVLMNYFNIPRFDVPELLRDADSSKKFKDVWFSAPGMKYIYGYNEDMGDTGLLTKTKIDTRYGM